MAERLTPDICVIGAGSGGLSVTAAAAAFGVPVVLIEKAKMGGDCLNTGCVPSKALLAAAKRAQVMRSGASFGVSAPEPTVDFAKVHDHVHGVIAAIAPNDSVQRFAGLGVRVIQGQARFKDRKTVAVGDQFEIQARRFVIATGSSPAIPPIPGLADTTYLTNETVFDLSERPQHLIVIGAGPIGLELAQAFRRLGSGVTVLEAAAPLAKDDPECAAIVLDRLEREGVAIRTGVKVVQVKRANEKVQVVLAGADSEETIEGSHLLVATGRRPNSDELDLEKAGVETDGRGFIKVNGRLETNVPGIWALGDVKGGPAFTHISYNDYQILYANIAEGKNLTIDHRIVPYSVFTDPQLGRVGLTEKEARAKGHRLKVGKIPMTWVARAIERDETAGLMKLVVDADNDRVLGAAILASEGGELIQMLGVLMLANLPYTLLKGAVYIHPTLAEGFFTLMEEVKPAD